ncbi:Rsp5p-dependent ubiquitination, sorting of cargo proteins at the multivesicular body [Dissophora globulifera]|nr:Rsp5p-dependent ubiquitination, sorting of cargo proteins at the multivesicular body [Dissophora globulifera]
MSFSPSSASLSSLSTSRARQARKRALRQPSNNPTQESLRFASSSPVGTGTAWQEQRQQLQQLPLQLPQQQQQEQQQQQQQQPQPPQPQQQQQQRFAPVEPFQPPPTQLFAKPTALSAEAPIPKFPRFPADEAAPPSFPPPESDDEDPTWLVIIILTTAVIITIMTVIRSCGQKAGWLTGSPTPASPTQGGSSSGGRDGRSFRHRGYGAHHIPVWEVDPDATEERLAALSDADRQGYEAAQACVISVILLAFQIVHPPNSIPTDISLSQYLSIQEKGVSAWEFEASYDQQLFVHDRTELSFFGQVACVQTNLPVPKQQEVYYWEVKVFEKSPNTTISIGVAAKPFPATRLPGWNRQSAGYFSNNGQKYCNSQWTGYPFGPIYFEGDVIGCGYRARTGTIFYTRNGKRIDDAYTGFGRMNLFPTVGATGPCVLHVNFGQSGFVFVEANVKKWGLAPASGSLAPPPAYGSDLGSILLEVAGSVPNVDSVSSSSRRPILNSSSSRTQVPILGAVQRQDSTLGAGVGGGDVNGSGADQSADHGRTLQPVQISLSNMSAPPPNYSSLDRFGHARHPDNDAASVASTDSDESTTLLLGYAQPDPGDGDENEGHVPPSI